MNLIQELDPLCIQGEAFRIKLEIPDVAAIKAVVAVYGSFMRIKEAFWIKVHLLRSGFCPRILSCQEVFPETVWIRRIRKQS